MLKHTAIKKDVSYSPPPPPTQSKIYKRGTPMPTQKTNGKNLFFLRQKPYCHLIESNFQGH